MSQVTKQSVYNSIFSYLGIVIGYVNTILLFPVFLQPDEYGLTRVLTAAGLVFSNFCQLGATSIAIKFFPYFKNKSTHHNGFLTFLLILLGIGFLLTSLGFYLFQDKIIATYSKDSGLFAPNFNYIYVIVFFMSFFNVLDAYLRANFKTIWQTFLRTVMVRSLFTISVLLYYYKIIDFNTFIGIYIFAYGIICLVLLLYTIYLGHLKITKPVITKKHLKQIANFGFYAISGTGTAFMTNYIDVLMVGSMANLEKAAVYSVAFYIGSVISVPFQSYSKIIAAVISEAWKNNDLKQIDSIYKSSSNNQMIIGGLLFLGIWLNIDNLFEFLPENYQAGKIIVILIALGKLFDVITGTNGIIIQFSNYFKYILWINILLFILTVSTNYLLIPKYGIEGAAIATLISIVTINTLRMGLIYWFNKIGPFNIKSIYIILIFTVTALTVYWIPKFENIFIDIILRSLIITMIYSSLTYFSKVSTEFNSLVIKALKTLKILN